MRQVQEMICLLCVYVDNELSPFFKKNVFVLHNVPSFCWTLLSDCVGLATAINLPVFFFQLYILYFRLCE